jgi:hypothetical protein
MSVRDSPEIIKRRGAEGQEVILHIQKVEVFGPQMLRLAFNNGAHKVVDVSPFLIGPIFEPLRDPAYFARAQVDPIC